MSYGNRHAENYFQTDPSTGTHIALIVSPLRSLMFDQVARARSMGVRSVAVTRHAEMSVDDIESKLNL